MRARALTRSSFSIGSGPQTITLASALPPITEAVTINGATQPGFSGAPIIELNGNGVAGNGLHLSADNTTIRGVIVNRFAGAGISIGGAAVAPTR